MVEVVTGTVARGICRAARKLGVTYPYLWKVLNGRANSPSLLLKIEKEAKDILSPGICNVDAMRIIEENRQKYYWDPIKRRFVKKEQFDRRCSNSEE